MPPAVTRTQSEYRQRADSIAAELRLIAERAPVQRRVVKAGEVLFRVGQPMTCLSIITAGMFKSISLAADGREQIAGFHFRGDWLGFEGLAEGRHASEVVALDAGEVMTVEYDALLVAGSAHPELMKLLHQAMSRQQQRSRESMLAICTLGADARVADFLYAWADTLAERGLRADQITLRMTRAEIGSYLGLTLETVSRALSRLERSELIRFDEVSRRDICIPKVEALADFVQKSTGVAALH